MKKLLIFALILFGFLFCINPSYANDYDIPADYRQDDENLNVTVIPQTDEKFYIDHYVVHIKVNKDKSTDIVEEIDTYFTRSAHGIFRDIPTKSASVTNISVSEQKSITYNTNNVKIKIGDPDKLISGPHRYRISYKYSYQDNKNEFYHNIIGTQWGTYIKNVDFDITMPADIDPAKVGLSIGTYGVKGFNGGAVYSVNGNKITGHTQKILGPYEGMTIRVEVPEGYFTKYVNYKNLLVIIGIILLTIISFLTWYTYGKDEPVIPIVNFYPPKDLNAAEVELAYKGNASTKGLVALLIELAHEGYIKINSEGNHFCLEKRSSYLGSSKVKKKFMNALFKYGKKSIDDEDLKKSKTFYEDCGNIIEDLNKKRTQIFYDYSIGFSLKASMFICLFGLVFLLLYALSNYNLFTMGENIILAIFPIFAIIVLVGGLTTAKNNPFRAFFFIIWSAGFGGIPLLILISQYLRIDNIPTILLGIAGLIIAGVCTYQLPKRNPNGQRLLNNLTGLKNFIDVAEKHRLQQLVDQDPEYFYNILPAAYVLNVSDEWIKKFESIMQIQPDWYSGTTFNVHSFNHFASHMNSYSVPSTANGGISSSSGGGGGFSGGGGGGGGGGSW